MIGPTAVGIHNPPSPRQRYKKDQEVKQGEIGEL